MFKLGNTEINAISLTDMFSKEDFGVPDSDYRSLDPDWTRPDEWLDMPVINSGDNKIAILMAVPSGYNPKDVGLNLSGSQNVSYNTYHTHMEIDWGDGSSSTENGVYSSVTSYHSYSYEDLPESTEFTYHGRPARQVIIQVDGSLSGIGYVNLGYLNGYSNPGRDSFYNNGQTNDVLDVHIDAPDMFNFYLSYSLDMENIHINCGQLTQNFNQRFSGLRSLRKIVIPSGCTSSVNSFDGAFGGCENLQELPMLDTSSVTNFNNAFNGCRNLRDFPPYNTSNVTVWNTAFAGCRSLRRLPDLDYRKASSLWNTFSSMDELRVVQSGILWPTGENISFDYTFQYDSNLIHVSDDISFDGASTMYQTFYNCKNLIKIPKINAPSATNLGKLFQACSSIEKIEIGDISSATSLYESFNGCSSLRSLTIDDAGSSITNLNNAFSNTRMTRLPHMNTQNVTNWWNAFSSNPNLQHVPVYDYSSCTTLDYIFQYCTALQDVKFKNLNTNLNSAYQAFYACSNLRSIPSGLFDSYGSCPIYFNRIFSGCSRLNHARSINLSRATHPSNNGPFYQTSFTSIEDVTFGSGVSINAFLRDNYYIEYIPDWDVSEVSYFNNAFYNTRSLSWCDMRGLRVSTSFYNCILSSGAIENIFNNLGSGVTGQSIDIRDNYGTSQLHPDTISIATSKGWTVTT